MRRTAQQDPQFPQRSTEPVSNGVRIGPRLEAAMPNPLIRNLCYLTIGTFLVSAAALPVSGQRISAPVAQANWQAPARWRHGLSGKTSGTLALTDSGIEFRPAKGDPLVWKFEEIQTFHSSPHRLELTGYQNRRWHLHGERSFRFDFEAVLPPAVAAELTARVGKPAANGVPNPSAPAFATLGARHRTRGGGTNGVLRFRDSGIDYVTDSGRGARSWRWADIETIARPNAFHFRVGGYREIFEFELKEPMSRRLFDRLWNDVYARDLSGLSLNGGPQ
jgi:hypothetical protein